MKLSVKAKLAASSGLVLLLATAAGGLSYWRLTELAASQQVLAARGQRVGAISDLQNALGAAGRTEKNIVIESDPKRIAEFNQLLAQQTADLARLRAEIERNATGEEQRLLAAAAERLAVAGRTQAETAKWGSLNSNFRASQLYQTEVLPQVRQLTAATDAFRDRLAKEGGEEAFRGVVAFERLRGDWLRYTRSFAFMLSSGSLAELEGAIKEADALEAAFRAELGRVKAVAPGLGQGAVDLAAQYEAAAPLVKRALATAGEGGNLRAATLTMGEGREQFNAAIKAYDEVAALIKREMDRAAAQGAADAENAKLMLLAILLGSLVVGIGTSTWIALAISRGLTEAVGLADAVAAGDLSRTLTVRSQDEIGALVVSLNAMTANLQANAAVAEAIAAGDLTVEASPCRTGTPSASPCAPCSSACAASCRRRWPPPATCRRGARNCRPPPSSCRRARPSRPPRPRRRPPRWRRWPPTCARTPRMPARPRRSPASRPATPRPAGRRWDARSRRCRRSPKKSPSCRRSPARPTCWR